MKSARLDRILLDQGHVDEEQVRVALRRQRTHGGRLGAQLIELGFLTSTQLTEALASQFDLPWQSVEASHVPPGLRGRLPPPGPRGSLAIPLEWDPDERVLTVALNDPEDLETLDHLRSEFGARRLVLFLAPDRDLAVVRRRIERGDLGEDDSGIIELPDLFPPSEADPDDYEPAARAESTAPAAGDAETGREVLLVTRRATHRSFLPAVFARDGIRLSIASNFEELRDALSESDVSQILIDQTAREDFDTWIRDRRLPALPARVARLDSVTETLVDTLIPYPDMIRSLRSVVEALADARTRDIEPPPPYGLLSRDVTALGRRIGLSTVAVEALHLAVHLLVPPMSETGSADSPVARSPFESFATSRELAVRLRFPWPIEKLLDTGLALFLGPRAPEAPGALDPEVLRAARALALVWFHHVHAPEPEAVEGDEALQMRAVLRKAASRLASMEHVEAYLQVIRDRREAGDVGDVAQVLVVGGQRASDLGSRLARSGIRPVVTRDLTDAQVLAERSPPAAIIVDRDAVPGHVDHFARVAKLDAALLVYVLTDATEPAATLALLDIGVDDVFDPPHDFDLIAARMARAIDSRSRVRAAMRRSGGDFSADFEVFAFLDLVQALGHGFKSVRIELQRKSTGEDAVLFLERGRPVHARAGDVTGPEAVYRVIAWEDDGEFTVHPESDFPEPTIEDSLESLLMEGCRLLDEARQ